MRSVWKYIITFVIAAILASLVWIVVVHFRLEKITTQYEGALAEANARLDALGDDVECYTVSEEFSYHYDYDTVGQILTEEALTPITVPSSLVGDAYVMDASDIIGKYCKVNIAPGTPITYDLLMSEWFDDTLRDVDITVNSRVVGMRVGDYVDIRITLPYGEDYVIFPHKRVQYIGDRSIKVYLTEAEWQTWQSATVDYYLNSAYGCRIYLTKYIEPGVQKVATAYYAPSDRVYAVMQRDPNIVQKAMAELTSLHRTRNNLDTLFNEFIDPDRDTVQTQGGLLSGGRGSWSNDVMTDYRTKQQNDEANSQGDEEDTYTESDVVVDLTEEGEETQGTSENTTETNGSVTFDDETQVAETQEGETMATEVDNLDQSLDAENGAVPAGEVGVPAGAEGELESQAPIEETDGLEDPDFAG